MFTLIMKTGDKMTQLRVTSIGFSEGETIPKKYTCEGENVNPPLKIENIPDDAKSMVVIMDDPDAPDGTWTHWALFNIIPGDCMAKIEENSIPGKLAANDFGTIEYGGPCPPSGEHRYFFRVFALNTMLNLEEGISRSDLDVAMGGHVLGQGELMGKFSK